MYNSFKIFSSTDGKKVLDFSSHLYKKDVLNPDKSPKYVLDSDWQPLRKVNAKWETQYVVEQSEVGYRLKIEWTDNGWNTKGIIFLQDQEVSDFMAVLLGKLKSAKAQRPDKTLTIEHQDQHCFVTLYVKNVWNEVNKKYSGKITAISAIKLLALWTHVLQQDLIRELELNLGGGIIKELVSDIYSSFKKPSEPEINPHTNFSSTSNQPVQGVQSNQQTLTDTGVSCSKCWKHMDPVKESKVISYSTQKYGQPVCYSCQQISNS